MHRHDGASGSLTMGPSSPSPSPSPTNIFGMTKYTSSTMGPSSPGPSSMSADETSRVHLSAEARAKIAAALMHISETTRVHRGFWNYEPTEPDDTAGITWLHPKLKPCAYDNDVQCAPPTVTNVSSSATDAQCQHTSRVECCKRMTMMALCDIIVSDNVSWRVMECRAAPR